MAVPEETDEAEVTSAEEGHAVQCVTEMMRVAVGVRSVVAKYTMSAIVKLASGVANASLR